MKINLKKVSAILSIIFLIEIFSFNIFLFSEWSLFFFVILNLVIIVLTLIKIEYGLLIAFVELIISSKGYLFSTSILNFTVSIRMSIFLIVLTLSFFLFLKYAYYKLKNNSFLFLFRDFRLYLAGNKEYYFLISLMFFSIIGVILGCFNNSIKNVFLDFNGWIYSLYLLPVFLVYLNQKEITEKKINRLVLILFSAITWISIKSLFLLYFFSHSFILTMPIVYKWVRDTGVGEITKMEDGFYRIFFQSHIFVLVASLILFAYFISKIIKKEFKSNTEVAINIFLLSLFLSVNILSFSRTNWLALILGFIVFLFIIFYNFKYRALISSLMYLVLISFLSLSILYFVIIIPFPIQGSNFSTSIITDRASAISGEAGVSSRWSLLPAMLSEIKQNPVFGSGFGTEITYKSSDPRVLEANKDGEYTTFSFEWGWLDFWIKIGFFGALSYLIFMYFLFISFFKDFFTSNNIIFLGISLSIFSLAVLNFFSPYLNHPLGIGLILFFLIAKKYFIKKA